MSELTIIIPSFCRQDYLVRQVGYWANSDATIIIMDGSPEPVEEKLKVLIGTLKNIFYYNRFDSYENRLKEACRLIKTPYAMCLADDDLYLASGLCCAVEYLQQNKECVACMGQAIGVDFDHQKGQAVQFPYGETLRGYSVTHEEPVRRVHLGIDNYRSATSYAVFRKSVFQEIWNQFQITSCLEAGEYEHAVMTYILGNLSTVGKLYWLRSFECDPVDSPIDGSRKLNFKMWWHAQECRNECQAFVYRLSRNLSKHAALSERDASKEIANVIQYILDGRHVGLMYVSNLNKWLSRVLKVIHFSSFIDHLFFKFKSTQIGKIARSRVMAILRKRLDDTAITAEGGMTSDIVDELKNALALITSFHEVRNLVSVRSM